MKKGEIEHWRKVRDRVDEYWGWSTAAGKLRMERRVKLITDLIEVISKKTKVNILELGCGIGSFTEKISEIKNINLQAIDIFIDFIMKAKKLVNPNVKFIVADAEFLPYPEKSFDMIFGVSVLHHLNFIQSLKECWRILKPEGKICFSEPNMLNPQVAI